MSDSNKAGEGGDASPHPPKPPRYLLVAGGIFAVATFVFLAYFLMVAIASALDASWLSRWIHWSSPVVQLERKVFPVFDYLEASMTLRGHRARILLVQHVVAVSWLAFVIIASSLGVVLFSPALGSLLPTLKPTNFVSLSWRTYLHLAFAVLICACFVSSYAFGWMLAGTSRQLALQNSGLSIFLLGAFSLGMPFMLLLTVGAIFKVARLSFGTQHRG